jgi:hypothetical protein
MNLKEAMKIIYALVVDAAGEGGDEEEQEAVDVFFSNYLEENNLHPLKSEEE